MSNNFVGYKVDFYHVQPVRLSTCDEHEVLCFQGSNVVESFECESKSQAYRIGELAKDKGTDCYEIYNLLYEE